MRFFKIGAFICFGLLGLSACSGGQPDNVRTRDDIIVNNRGAMPASVPPPLEPLSPPAEPELMASEEMVSEEPITEEAMTGDVEPVAEVELSEPLETPDAPQSMKDIPQSVSMDDEPAMTESVPEPQEPEFVVIEEPAPVEEMLAKEAMQPETIEEIIEDDIQEEAMPMMETVPPIQTPQRAVPTMPQGRPSEKVYVSPYVDTK
ncbi:MAG: hypothetical protein AAF549_03390 [Pseudomonadota bacterium]